MQSRYWSFVEACEEARTVRAVRDLLAEAVRSLGFDTFAVLTHAAPSDVRSLGVFAHNWSDDAVEHFLSGLRYGRSHPLFEVVEATLEPVSWVSGEWRRTLRKDQLPWLDRLCELTRGEGTTCAIRTPFVSASCSITGEALINRDRMRTCVRIARYAYHQIQVLQQPDLGESERLTAREHECLYRAAVHGERPSRVARRLGVKVSTVRTLRQKANGRLDADSPEQAVWRMLETGQLFRRGRTSKPRSR